MMGMVSPEASEEVREPAVGLGVLGFGCMSCVRGRGGSLRSLVWMVNEGLLVRLREESDDCRGG